MHSTLSNATLRMLEGFLASKVIIKIAFKFIFCRLDYSGISLLIIGSFVPWLYYAFYCRALAMAIYIGMIVVL